jgi:hypothetical protein
MHGKLQMAEDMDQWGESGHITRFAHINRAGIEARDVLLRRCFALLRRLL